ncbi:MAG: hypothetical protein BWY72_02339 [Bacteroidetes bacterium ADurb.Bin416]|nr:MAG: hypothetical protein BWY72_02339 [Bacteroidetes bacterium ADurb.Bin416]
MCGFPPGVIGFQVGHQLKQGSRIARHQKALVPGVGCPTAETMQFGQGFAVVAPVPHLEVFIQESLVFEPTALVEMMTECAGNEVVAVGVGTIHQKFGHDATLRGCLDVLAEGPPTVVIQFLEVGLGAVEQGDVGFHPIPGLCVGNGLHLVFVFHPIEIVHEPRVIVGI